MNIEWVLQISHPTEQSVAVAEQSIAQVSSNQDTIGSYKKVDVVTLRVSQGQYEVINKDEITPLQEGESFKLGNLLIHVQELKNKLAQHSTQNDSAQVNQQAPLYLNLEPNWLMMNEEQCVNNKTHHSVIEYNSLDFLHEQSTMFSFTNNNPLSVYFKEPIFIEKASLLSIKNQKQANILEEINTNQEY